MFIPAIEQGFLFITSIHTSMFRDLFTNANPQRTKNILSAIMLLASVSIGISMIVNYAFSEYAFNVSDAAKPVNEEVVENSSAEAETQPEPQPVEARDLAPTEQVNERIADSADSNTNSAVTPTPTKTSADPVQQQLEITPDIVTVEEAVQTISVSIQVQGPGASGAYEPEVEAGSTAFQAMKAAKKDGLRFATGDFPGLGVYIEGVNGVSEDAKAGLYWIYYVNGVKAKTGVSNYTVKNGDTIKWVLEPDINR